MAADDLRHVFQRYPGIPDVVWIDKDDGAFLVAAGTGVSEHGGRRDAAPVHLLLESLEQLAATLGAAAPLAGCGAHEDLAKSSHAKILFRSRYKSNGGIRLQASPTLALCTYGIASKCKAVGPATSDPA